MDKRVNERLTERAPVVVRHRHPEEAELQLVLDHAIDELVIDTLERTQQGRAIEVVGPNRRPVKNLERCLVGREMLTQRALAPQAWAAATPFALVAAAIGCVIDPQDGRLTLDRPVLPKFLDDLTIRNIAIGEARVDLRLARVDGDVTTAVLRRDGDVLVTINK